MTTFKTQFATLCNELIKRLRSAQGDINQERISIKWAVEELKTFYSGDTPAELLRDGGEGHEGIGMSADDEEFERWSDLIADACGY